jgi:capsid protein
MHAALTHPRSPAALGHAPGTVVLTPALAFSMEKSGALRSDPARPGVMQWGAYHGSQDTRFRDYTTGGFSANSRPESDYFPRYDRARVIARLRVGFRNNPYLAALLRAYVLEIGTPHLKSQTADEIYNDKKERLFERWALDCEAEHDLSLDQVIEIYNYEACLTGELFILKRREGWLQLIASELCGSASTKELAVNPVGTPALTVFADGTVVPVGATECDGIIRDASKFVIGYRFGSRDATGQISFAVERSTLVQAQFVWHLFDPDRVEQGRGVPLLAPVMNALQDVFETSEARAQQVKNASCLSLWITKNIDPYGYAEAMRGAFRGSDLSNVQALKEVAEQRSAYQDLKKGSIYYGAAGEDLRLIEPKLGAADFHEHYIDLLQVCAACLNGLPVEIGLEGFRASSYSSARATVNKWKRNVARIRKRLCQKFLEPLQLWQSNRAHLFGDLPPAPKATDGTYNTDENVRFGWPPIPDIDGAKTSAQNALDLANGTTTRDEILSDRGLYGDEIDRVFAHEKARQLKDLMDAGEKVAGLSKEEAKAWALAQTTGGEGVSALLGPIVSSALAPEPAKPGAVAARTRKIQFNRNPGGGYDGQITEE